MHENKIAAALLVLFFILTVAAASTKSGTVDELIFSAAGYSYVKTLDFRLSRELPPLMKTLSGLFMLPFNPKLPEDGSSWQQRKHIEYGLSFWFKENIGRHDFLLFFARLPSALAGVLLGWVIYMWASALYDKRAGLFSLAMYSLEPNFLAHAGFATTDVGASAFITLSLYLCWRWHKQNLFNSEWKNVLAIGVAIGLANGAKTTGLYLFPIFGLLFSLQLFSNSKLKTPNKLFALGVMIVVAAVVVASLYAFQDFDKYIDGVKLMIDQSKLGRPSFLFEEYGMGWWYYFPVAFAIKMPIPTLIIFALTLTLLIKNRKHDEFYLIIPAAVLFAGFMLNKINIGFRHVLPVLPFLFILSGKVADFKITVCKRNISRMLCVALVVWLAVETLFIYPHFLAYFNEFVGGPKNGYNYLSDSNIDWGQDLKGLTKWMAAHDVENLTLGYWGYDSTALRNISVSRSLECFETSGLLAVSVNKLNGFDQGDYLCTEWLRKYKPIDSIGYSILIYNITSTATKEQGMLDYCVRGCKKRCEAQQKKFNDGRLIEGKCVCGCG